MRRSRNDEHRSPEQASPPAGGFASYADIVKQHPLRLPDGRPNPDYFRALYAAISCMAFDSVMQGQQVPFNADQLRKFVDSEAEAAGFDPKVLADARAPEEKALDAARQLRETPEALLEMTDEVLDALEKAMDIADSQMREYQRGKMREADADPKGFRRRIARVRRLRDRARHPVGRTVGPNHQDRLAAEAAHLLRFMAYVGRSNMEGSARSPAAFVFKFGMPHVKMAAALWEFENGIQYTPDSVLRDHIPYRGAVLTCPPGFGKTELIVHWAALEMHRNRRTQGVLLHAKAERAEKNLAYLGNCLDPEQEVGRRYMSLFPDMGLEQRNSKQMRIRSKFSLKEPTWSASGDNAKALGRNTNVIVADDVVPQSDAEQETERERRCTRFAGTWLSRQRGGGTKLIIIGNIWHHDDMHSRMIRLAEKAAQTGGREGVLLRVSRQRVGGPKSHPPFFTIWPEVYPAAELRKRFFEMNNPALWASAYELNPLPDEQKLVRKLRLYDPSGEEHKRFLRSATYRLSIDPAGTRNLKSDKAGVLYAAHGEVVAVTGESHDRTYTSAKKLRVLDAWELTANQVDIVQWSLLQMERMKVDYLHVESRSGYAATGDIFQHYHGVPVVRYDPKNRDKKERLKSVSPMIEDLYADTGIQAVVEFPCELGSDGRPALDAAGQMRPDPRLSWLVRQIVEFGFCGADHAVDALTQLLIGLMSELDVGSPASQRVVRSASMTREERGRRLRTQQVRHVLRGTDGKKPAELEDAEWINGWTDHA